MYRCVSIGPMKNPKLLVPVRCTTRKFYLHKPPPGRNDWHVRFVPPAIDGVRRVVFRSTGTKEIGAAKRIAADIIKSFWIDSGRSAVRLKLRDDNATVGELIAKYKERAAQRPGTIRSNVRRAKRRRYGGRKPDRSGLLWRRGSSKARAAGGRIEAALGKSIVLILVKLKKRRGIVESD